LNSFELNKFEIKSTKEQQTRKQQRPSTGSSVEAGIAGQCNQPAQPTVVTALAISARSYSVPFSLFSLV
jgi:hypothetical protein